MKRLILVLFVTLSPLGWATSVDGPPSSVLEDAATEAGSTEVDRCTGGACGNSTTNLPRTENVRAIQDLVGRILSEEGAAPSLDVLKSKSTK